MYRETNGRSVAKAISWRILGTLATAVLVFIFTGRLVVALAVGTLEFFSKIVLFWLHERIWDRVKIGRREAVPAVIWFTGLSGSGKTTISRWVYDDLKRRGLHVEYLDGDTIRDLFPNTGFSKDERDQHIRRVGYLASKLEQNGVFVVASFISPYCESRQFVRELCKNFVEVYVSTPIEVCEARDVKGLYARARRGEISNFTGISDPYEPPMHPELTIDTQGVSVDQAGAMVLSRLRRHF